MNRRKPRSMAASVRQRLFDLAREKDEPFDLILVRFALERLLYRISQSPWHRNFVMKGAMLFSIWLDNPYRPTRDLDLMGYGANDIDSLENIFRSLCSVKVEEDGIMFIPESVRGLQIRDNNEYQGVRIQLKGSLAGAAIAVQVDIGYGDVVTPLPEEISFPSLLDFPAPKIRAYTKYTVVSEKLQAMVMLGLANSRMKDFYDIWVLARECEFEGSILGQAIQATFDRRRTNLTGELPQSLTETFFTDPGKNRQWRAFASKDLRKREDKCLSDIVGFLKSFLEEPLLAAGKGEKFNFFWPAAGPWREKHGNQNDG